MFAESLVTHPLNDHLVSLPDSIDQDKIKATHKDGILNVVIPKRDEAKEKPKKQIKIS